MLTEAEKENEKIDEKKSWFHFENDLFIQQNEDKYMLNSDIYVRLNRIGWRNVWIID